MASKPDTTVAVALTGATRLPNSPSGNPTWMLHTRTGDYRTKPNTMCAFNIESFCPRNSDPAMVTLTLTPAGRVRGISYTY